MKNALFIVILGLLWVKLGFSFIFNSHRALSSTLQLKNHVYLNRIQHIHNKRIGKFKLFERIDKDQENKIRNAVETNDSNIHEINHKQENKSNPIFVLFYDFFPKYVESVPPDFIKSHESHCTKFKRLLSSEIIKIFENRGAISIFMAENVEDKENTLNEAKVFLASDPLMEKGVIKHWDLAEFGDTEGKKMFYNTNRDIDKEDGLKNQEFERKLNDIEGSDLGINIDEDSSVSDDL